MTLHAIDLIFAVPALALGGLLAYRLAKLPAALRGVAQSLGAISVQPSLADQPADLPWVSQLDAAATTTTRPDDGATAPVLGAGDWYDPTVQSIPQTFNEAGFITSPSPAPVDPNTGRVPLTNGDVCAWAGHAPGNPCPRCGVPNA